MLCFGAFHQYTWYTIRRSLNAFEKIYLIALKNETSLHLKINVYT